jgi:hypothetical protein
MICCYIRDWGEKDLRGRTLAAVVVVAFLFGAVPATAASVQPSTGTTNQTSNRSIVGTTVAAASNGSALSAGTLHVTSTGGFSSSGVLILRKSTDWSKGVAVAYTGTSGGNAFTGCRVLSGSDTLVTAQIVAQGYVNGSSRRHVDVTARMSVIAAFDYADAVAFATVGSALLAEAQAGVAQWPSTTMAYVSDYSIGFDVNPGGIYGVVPVDGITAAGAGTIAKLLWFETNS